MKKDDGGGGACCFDGVEGSVEPENRLFWDEGFEGDEKTAEEIIARLALGLSAFPMSRFYFVCLSSRLNASERLRGGNKRGDLLLFLGLFREI